MMYLKLTCSAVALFMLLPTLSALSASVVSAVTASASLDDVENDNVEDALIDTSVSLRGRQCPTQTLNEMCLCKRSGNESDCVQPAAECVKHTDCCTRKRLHCYAGKCVKNVCKGKCGPNTLCTVSIRNKAVCSCKPGYTGNPKDKRTGCKPAPDCVEHKDCCSGQFCYAGKCVKNVCTDNCGANTECTVSIDNKAVCSCKLGYTGHPEDKSKGCEPNPTKPNKTFYWGPFEMNWLDAKGYCEKKGHKLARILNEEENNQVLAIINDIFTPTPKTGVWVGGYVLHDGQPGYWVNPHTVFEYSYFHSGEPYGCKKENCLEFWKNDAGWKWRDESCSMTLPFICEKNNN